MHFETFYFSQVIFDDIGAEMGKDALVTQKPFFLLLWIKLKCQIYFQIWRKFAVSPENLFVIWMGKIQAKLL